MMVQVDESTKDTFRNKNILLTGATGGLGTQLAIQLIHCNVNTLVLSGRNPDALQKVADQCKQEEEKISTTTTTNIHLITCDLSNRESVLQLGQQALSAVVTTTPTNNNNNNNVIHVLIHCGGVSSRSNFVDTKLEIDERLMQINFFSGASLAKTLIPSMIQNNNENGKDSSGGGGGGGGTTYKIIWISSVQGLFGIPSRTSYAASKFAVQGYCEALRPEVARHGIAVHCVSPGYIRTNLSRSALTGDGTTHGKMDATTEKGANPEDVAVTILNSVSKGKNDFVVAATASAIGAIWLKLLCPTLLQKLMVKRFEKSELQKLKED